MFSKKKEKKEELSGTTFQSPTKQFFYLGIVIAKKRRI